MTVSIKGQVATTEIDQAFFNPNDQQLEGTYLFPVPRGAKIDSFSIDIDGKLTEAELLDASKARKIYEKDSPANGTSATVFRLTDCP